MKVAILASGSGSNAQAIIECSKNGALHAKVVLVLSNKKDAPVLQKAANANIPAKFLDPKLYASREEYDRALLSEIAGSSAECVCLAGYMLLLSKQFLENYAGPVLNIHPSILPAFPGAHGIDDARSHGVKITGVTVHFVNEDMDMGPIIIQAALPLPDDADMDAYMKGIHAIEHRIYPQAIEWLSCNRLRVKGRQVTLIATGVPLAEIPKNLLIWPPLEKGF